MSFRHAEAMIPLDGGSSTQRSILLALCHHADQFTGACYPSIARLKALLGYDERTIQRALGEIERMGWISRDAKPGRVTVYTVTLPAAPIIHQHTPGTAPPPSGRAPPPPGTAPDELKLNGIQKTSDARASSYLESWKPGEALLEWCEREFPGVDVDTQVEIFLDRNKASGVVPANMDAAFRGFMRRVPSLRTPPPQRRTKASEAAAAWSPERRAAYAAHLTRTKNLSRAAAAEAYREWEKRWPPGATYEHQPR